MIHYYTYYSVGGYKDMYLGNSEMNYPQTYYFSLLPIMRKKAEESQDAALMEEVQRQERIPTIKIIDSKNDYGFPQKANTLVAHGGYKLVYCHLEEDKYIVLLKDVVGGDKDENGRSIPFLMSFWCDSPSDLDTMNRLAAYLTQNTKTAENKFVEFLHYDPVENGLCFEVAKMNAWVKEITQTHSKEIALVNGSLIMNAQKDRIELLTTLDGISKDYVLRELKMEKVKGNFLPVWHILPQDNLQLAEKNKERWQETQSGLKNTLKTVIEPISKKLQKIISKLKLKHYIAIGIVVLIILIIILCKSCGN